MPDDVFFVKPAFDPSQMLKIIRSLSQTMWFFALWQPVPLLECLLVMLPARGEALLEQHLARLQKVKSVEIVAKN